MSAERSVPHTPTLLIHTSAWLDLFLPGRQGRDDVQRLLACALSKDIALAYAAHAIVEVFTCVEACHTLWVREQEGELPEGVMSVIRAEAWECARIIQEYATAIPVDSTDVYLACKLRTHHNRIEDALVLAACKRAKASYLVTCDETLLANADICAKTPAGMLSLMGTW